MKRVKVLQVVDTLGMGGAEIWLMEVLRHWNRKTEGALAMDFLITSGRPGCFDDEARELGAQIFYVRFQKQRLQKFATKFRQILREEQYSAIHDHQGYAAGWHFFLGLGALPPVKIAHFHNSGLQIRGNYGVSVLRRLTAGLGREWIRRFATHITGTSHQVLGEYGFEVGQFRNRSKGALHCGFDVARRLEGAQLAREQLCAEFGWPEDVKIILFAGRIDRSVDPRDPQMQKNAPFAVQVGIECVRKDPRARMLLVGAGSPAVPEMERWIEKANCHGKVIFAGIRTDIALLMLASDLLLFPSLGEGLGMVAVEAQAVGLPVLASTGVPRECIVIPDLVEFLSLAAPMSSWVSSVMARLNAHRSDPGPANARVSRSAFSVINSAQKLADLYLHGRLETDNASGKLKVLQIVDTLGMGGAETWLMEVLRLWSRDPEGSPKMDFLITSGQEGIFDEEARKLGARIFYVKFQKRRIAHFMRQFRRILETENYAAIHDHQDYASGWHFLMGFGHLPKIRVTHVHNPSYQIRSNYGTSASRRLTASIGRRFVRRFATHIAGTSRQVLGEYGFDSSTSVTQPYGSLHCGFDPARFTGDCREAKSRLCAEFEWRAGSKIILFAGRIDRSADPLDPQAHKNAPLAIEIGIECVRRDPEVRMLSAGALSPAVPELQSRLDAAGCRGKIVFAGVRKDIEQLMLGSDVLLFPSRGEGLGMVAVEAQAAGLPVIASSAVPEECMVIPELVEFIPLTAPVSVWAERLLLRVKADRRNPVPDNARVASSEFSIVNSAQRLAKLYAHGTL